MNNPQKIGQSVYLSIEEVDINNKKILSIYVPASSQVHKCNGKIFDRNEDGDFDITENSSLVTALYMNKQTVYTENKIYPYCDLEDLRSDLISRARKLAVNQRPNHPWKDMNDMELLKSAKLFSKDYQTNQEEFTGLKHREYFRKSIMTPLIEKGLLKLTIPAPPHTSPNQK